MRAYLKKLGYALSIVGAVGSFLVTKEGYLTNIAWNVFPYFVGAGFIYAYKKSEIGLEGLVGVIFMLLVDTVLWVLMISGKHSEYLMAVSLVSTGKLFVVFPIGLIIGFIITKMPRKNKKKKGPDSNY